MATPTTIAMPTNSTALRQGSWSAALLLSPAPTLRNRTQRDRPPLGSAQPAGVMGPRLLPQYVQHGRKRFFIAAVLLRQAQRAPTQQSLSSVPK